MRPCGLAPPGAHRAIHSAAAPAGSRWRPLHYERHRPEQTTLYRLVRQHAASGSFEGSVNEAGAGSVVVMVNFGMSFKGEIDERDGSSVTAEVDGLFEGNIVERLGGNVSTSGSGIFKGNSEFELPGT